VRARLEKSGQMDALRNQIVERKVVELITSQANITDEPVKHDGKEGDKEFAIYHNVVRFKDHTAIPEAKYDDAPAQEADAKSGKDKDKEKD